jgi:uncharacterized coiled-coil DUF342 family protein
MAPKGKGKTKSQLGQALEEIHKHFLEMTIDFGKIQDDVGNVSLAFRQVGKEVEDMEREVAELKSKLENPKKRAELA